MGNKICDMQEGEMSKLQQAVTLRMMVLNTEGKILVLPTLQQNLKGCCLRAAGSHFGI